MSIEWKSAEPWTQNAITTPYVHWWRYVNGVDEKKDPEGEGRKGYKTAILHNPQGNRGGLELDLPEEMVNRSVDSEGRVPPVTRGGSPYESELINKEDLDELKKLDLDENTVIVGIVDVGIPLGHRRLRLKCGKTRFLASWQQSAKFDCEQQFLPTGQELYAHDIDELLAEHSGQNRLGPLDEDAFNRAAGLVAPNYWWGQRALDYRAAHGAHVLDLAAGCDPARGGEVDPERTRIIAVNLPPRSVNGTAGNFLSYFAKNAVGRILFLADALWDAKFKKLNGKGGFPVVINFSFGTLAGPKDGSSDFEREVQKLVRKRNKRAPTRLVMPAGNNNLSRAHARKLVGSEGCAVMKRKRWNRKKRRHEYKTTAICVDPELHVPWRILPSDYTSNFLEIWTKSRDRNSGDEAKQEATPDEFQLWVTPPGSSEELEVRQLAGGEFSQLGDYARVYCYVPSPDGDQRSEADGDGQRYQNRAHFVICVAPTLSYDPVHPQAPAGLWKVSLRYPGLSENHDEAVIQEVTFTVQADQSGLPGAVTGRQSYFDDPNYRVYSERGRLNDSYGPGKSSESSGPSLESWNKFGPVQRKGTQNALATWGDVIVIGSYRKSDDTPALYSSTFDGNSKRGGGRNNPTVMFPSDDGAAHPGILAAGARDGSVVALRGTSMATALATRIIASTWAHKGKGKASLTTDYEGWFGKKADDYRKKRKRRMKRYNALKQGRGLVEGPDVGRIERFPIYDKP